MSLQNQADLAFMALCIWREARGEPREAKVAVGHSIMNRITSPSWGNTITSVIFQRLQYSSLTYDKDPQLTTWPLETDKSWIECLEVADQVLEGALPNPIDGADSYFADSISRPTWATDKTFVTKIGRHEFHKVGR
jgi:spore germination cell wall hydrolase CwlJ-like protein